MCDEWNGLAEDVVMAGSLVTFEASLIITSGMLGGLFKLRFCLLFIGLPSLILLHAGWQYGKTEPPNL